MHASIATAGAVGDRHPVDIHSNSAAKAARDYLNVPSRFRYEPFQLTSKADFEATQTNVCFVPITDIGLLLDDVVGASEKSAAR
jgi:hypothetical protein